MSSPVLHVLAGPNGAGKSTFAQVVLQPVTHLPFINADEIAALRWPGQEAEHAYDASAAAMAARDDALSHRRSFITETVFSHPSKVDLIKQSILAGYLVTLHVILIPEDVAVMRVEYRVTLGGHTVPETKVRERYRRLWDLIAEARDLADRCIFYDNSLASTPFLPIANYESGRLIGDPAWPGWTPSALTRHS
ncbi:zeta toxin family protein [Arthrobacter sp. UYEF20]|uniref:zeta toxin family protein n=1 Tax=Arthrobacter sp. UYEF20 TaxID=1756363 RepID=UPI003397E08C